MGKIFISHSSRDKKHYVRPLVDKLIKTIGKDKIIFDELTFEKGSKSINEIRKSLDSTDLFVLLISKSALKSEWVRQEISWARELEDTYSQQQRILPVIIDSKITHKSKLIPDWLKVYNLKFLSSPSKLSRIILARFTEIIWQNSSSLREKTELFIGRNSEMETFENRIIDPQKDSANFIIISGVPSSGRRTFLRHALNKASLVSLSYSSPTILLDGHQSIEDFIQELANLTDEPKITGLMESSLEEKIDQGFNLLCKLNEELDDKLLIYDQGAIVTHNGEIAEWFKRIINRFCELEYNSLSTCLISRHRPNNVYRFRNILHLPLDLLSPKDRIKLLYQYGCIEGIELSKKEVADLSPVFSGYPEEIFYAVELIKTHSKKYLFENSDLISEFSDNKISAIISEYKYSEEDNKVLKIISRFNYLSLDSIYTLLDFAKIPNQKESIEKYFRHGLLSKIGLDGEYFMLNSAAKNYYERQVHLDVELNSVFKEFVQTINFDSEDTDLPDEVFAIQEKLRSGQDIPIDKVVPSYYLKTMKNLYDNRKDRDVIRLADIVLESANLLDNYIRDEIMFFLCSSLARLKEERFKDEAQYFSDYKYDFLFGFYYRQIGNYRNAVDRFERVLKDNKNYSQAKRELVLLYNKLGEYDKAYSLAKANYENNKGNPYHIHAYFQSVLYQKDETLPQADKKELLERLLSDFSKIDSPNARNMYLISKAKYYMEFDRDIESIEKVLNAAKAEFPSDNTYLLLFQVDFYEKTKNLTGLQEVRKYMVSLGFNRSENNYYNDYLKAEIFINALQNNMIELKSYLNRMTVSENLRNNIFERANHLMSGRG